jgi:hypothetical protein
MSQYTYVKEVRGDVLQTEAIASGLPVTSVSTSSTTAYVYTSRDLTPAEKTTLDNVVAAHDGRPRQKRPLYEIDTDVNALTGSQLRNAWNDLAAPFASAAHKYLTTTGQNAGTMYALTWTANNVTTAEGTAAQRSIISCYAQDYPSYLVHPPFDPTINVPGDEPVP